jgi:PAS domain S-box-containing protein
MGVSCFALLALGLYQAIWNASELTRGRELVVRTFEVMATARTLERAIREAELSQRNFVITGQTSYLEPYRIETRTALDLLSKLKRLTVDDAGQRLRMLDLDAKIDLRLAELASVTRARESDGLEAALRLMRNDLAAGTTRVIHELIDATVATEDALQKERLAAATKAERANTITAAAGGALAVVILGLGFFLVQNAIRAVRRSGEAQRRSEEYLRVLVNGVVDYAIFRLDPEGFVTSWNAGAQRINGYTEDEIIGQHFSCFFTEEDRKTGAPGQALETAAREGKYEIEALRVRKDGSRFFAHVVIDPLRGPSGQLLGFAKITRDITERRSQQEALERARAALAQSQKMEALGQLTGGIAHDFNNLLTVITGSIDMLRRRLQSGDRDVGGLIDAARRGADRGANLTERLLAFSRRQQLESKPLNPNKLVAGMVDILRRTLGEVIEVETVLASDLGWVSADSNQLENAILNLAVNARDAMPRGGKLILESANVSLDGAYAAAHDDVAAGEYAMIAVSDTGSGMTKEIVAKAFEPFFTTKEAGQGTGLGLSQVYGFIKQSRGHVSIYSEPGAGTTVRLYLPRIDAPPAAELPIETKPVAGAAAEEAILVVEDNEDVRAFTTQALGELGYRVLGAADARSALQTLEKEPDIDLLFTDVELPGGVNGRQLAEEAHRRWPTLKVLFTTGYTRTAILSNGRLNSGLDLITKPFTQTSLAEKVRKVLDRGQATSSTRKAEKQGESRKS